MYMNMYSESWAKQKIRTKYDGYFDDQVIGKRVEWNTGKEVSLQEVVVLKLYTDFDRLQKVLKKSFRYDTIDDMINPDTVDVDAEKKDRIRADLKNYLESFYHWRSELLVMLNKFGTKWRDKNMNLYHGVNAKMVIKPSRSFAFSGPLSTTSSCPVAHTFATEKGMVLTFASHFPRLGYCNAFDASLISDFPQEQEWLIGFMYVRLLKVRTRNISVDACNDENACKYKMFCNKCPWPSYMRDVFFAIHLFGQQMYSMSDHLEMIVNQLLKCNRHECCVESQHAKFASQAEGDWREDCMMVKICHVSSSGHKDRSENFKKMWENPDLRAFLDTPSARMMFKILPIVVDKFNEFRNNPNAKQRIKFDTISSHLKRFFMKREGDNDIETGQPRWVISFDNIVTVYPNAKELHFINEYTLDDRLLLKLINRIKNGLDKTEKEYDPVYVQWLEEKGVKSMNIEKVHFLYYDYQEEEESGQPKGLAALKNPDELDPELVEELNVLGWVIKHRKNGKSGYKIRVYKC